MRCGHNSRTYIKAVANATAAYSTSVPRTTVQDPRTPPPKSTKEVSIASKYGGPGRPQRTHRPPLSLGINPGLPPPPTNQAPINSRTPSSVSASLLNSNGIVKMAAISSRNLLGTPKRKTSQRDFRKDKTVKGQGKAIMSTMNPDIPQFDKKWLKDLLEDDLVDDIEEWVFSPISPFDTAASRWTGIAQSPGLERNLYTPFVDLLRAILDRYAKPAGNIDRKVIDMHAIRMEHLEGHHTSPDIVIRGRGPSFEMPPKRPKPRDEANHGTNPSSETLPKEADEVGYGNTVTFFEVKLKTVDKIANIEQTAVYSRQIFIHQPNRWFVRAFIISQKEALLVHWDRGGLQKSHCFDIHEHPADFVGLVTKRGISGSIGPWSSDDQIHGSGTVWWSVIDRKPKLPELKKLLVKDSWSAPGRTEEWKLLQRAAENNIKGVCELIFHKDRRAQISNFRDGDMFFDRIFSRLVTKEYGGKIDGFTKGVQLLAALRDAVAAHGNLYGIGILHRNISNRTILLGRQGADIGEQGILIDLGEAFDFYRDADSEINKEPTMGPRFYQSSMILSFLTGLHDDRDISCAPAHDYLDDMESFFDVFCHTIFGFHPNGFPRSKDDKAHVVLQDWDAECPRHALAAKSLILNPALLERELAMEIIRETWGPAFEKLLGDFSDWLFKINLKKAKLARGYKEKIRELLKAPQIQAKRTEDEDSDVSDSPQFHESVFAPLYLKAEIHYKKVVEMFHTAIESVQTSPNSGPPPSVSIPDPTFDKKDDKGKGVKRQHSFSEAENTQCNKISKSSEGSDRTRRPDAAGQSSLPQLQGSSCDVSMDTTA